MSNEEVAYYSTLEPFGDSSSSCGYCGSKSGSSWSYGVWAYRLSAQVYQLMMDRGWRRSGSYLYLPLHRQTCCPPYTIRLSASGFQSSRGQRQAAYRWRNFIKGVQDPSAVPKQGAQKNTATFDLPEVFNSIEDVGTSEPNQHGVRKFNIKLELAKFSEEKFELYKKYQVNVHNDPIEKITEKSFTGFLCTDPFPADPPVAHHACWLIDDKLIAFSVIDILPSGISSVYLVWDPEYAKYGLGRVTVLKELAWIQEWKGSKFDSNFDWYYLGFYIHSCPKMRYKGEYSPSFLLDPSTLAWKPFKDCIPLLNASTTNLVTFSSQSETEENASGQDNSFPVRVVDSSGEIGFFPASCDPVLEDAFKRLGPEILKQCLICL